MTHLGENVSDDVARGVAETVVVVLDGNERASSLHIDSAFPGRGQDLDDLVEQDLYGVWALARVGQVA